MNKQHRFFKEILVLLLVLIFVGIVCVLPKGKTEVLTQPINGVYSQTYHDNHCDDGSSECTYEIILTEKNITVYYTNSVSSTIMWRGLIAMNDLESNDIRIGSVLDSDFDNEHNTSRAMFTYNGNHKCFHYISRNGKSYLQTDVPVSDSTTFRTHDILLPYKSQDVV